MMTMCWILPEDAPKRTARAMDDGTSGALRMSDEGTNGVVAVVAPRGVPHAASSSAAAAPANAPFRHPRAPLFIVGRPVVRRLAEEEGRPRGRFDWDER